MCGRFIDPNLRGTEVEFAELKITPFPRRFNVKPTQDVLILSGVAKDPLMARWWLIPSWFKGHDAQEWKATTFNARIEEAQDKPTFRDAWRNGRCLIPASGFYEWTGEKGHREPHVIILDGNAENMFFAGLASRWGRLLTCTIVTRAANGTMSDLHTRMPVILNLEERDAWLSGSDDLSIGDASRVRHYPVRPFGTKDEGPELIEPI